MRWVRPSVLTYLPSNYVSSSAGGHGASWVRRNADAGEVRWRREEWWDRGLLRFVTAAGVSALQPQITLLERMPGHWSSLLPLVHTITVGGRAVLLKPVVSDSSATAPPQSKPARSSSNMPCGAIAADVSDIIWGLQLVSPTWLAASSNVWRALRDGFLQDLRVIEALGRGEEEVWGTFRRRSGLFRLRSAVVLGEATLMFVLVQSGCSSCCVCIDSWPVAAP